MFTQKYDFFEYHYTIEDTEIYLQEVVRNNYNKSDTLQIFQALTLASLAHKTQVRDDNMPFIIHPMRVALMLTRYDRNITSKVFIAALLHDTLEWTDLKINEIEERFGKYVAKLVKSVSRRRDTVGLQEQCEAKRQNWQELIASCHEARAIKTFEDLDNLISLKAIPQGSPTQKKIPLWLEETREMSLPLAHTTNMQAYEFMKKEYISYIERGYADIQRVTK